MAHYVKNSELFKIVCQFQDIRNSPDGFVLGVDDETPLYKSLYEQIAVSARLIAHNYLNRHNLRRYDEVRKFDFEYTAVMNILIKIDKFKRDKSENPFAYFTQIAKNSFKSVLKEDNKYYDNCLSIDFYDTLGESKIEG